MRTSRGTKQRAGKISVRHEFPRCVIKAYARSRARATLAFWLFSRGPTDTEVWASDYAYLNRFNPVDVLNAATPHRAIVNALTERQ